MEIARYILPEMLYTLSVCYLFMRDVLSLNYSKSDIVLYLYNYTYRLEYRETGDSLCIKIKIFMYGVVSPQHTT